MIKFYIPDGHLEKKTLELFERAGFEVMAAEREYNLQIDDPEVVLKMLRPQDFPFVLAIGKGDLAIVGSDILEEFKLKYPDKAGRIQELLDLGFGKTSLCVAVSEDVMPGVKNIEDFRKFTENREVVVATEYPNITGEYLKKKGVKAIIRKPAGKTEAWLTPPVPEADLIVETTETGRTLRKNRCVIIDSILEATARLVCNKESLRDKGGKKKVDELVMLFRGALEGRGKVNVCMNVLDSGDLEPVLDVLREYVEKPTINDLRDGGYDIFIVIDERKLKYLLPELRRLGASSIAVSDTRMLI